MTPEAQLALISIFASAIPAMIAAWVSISNTREIRETKAYVLDQSTQLAQTDARVLDLGIKTDGKLTQLLDTSIANANAAGRVEGTAIERDRIAVETAAKNAQVVGQIEAQVNRDAIPIPSGPDPKALNDIELT